MQLDISWPNIASSSEAESSKQFKEESSMKETQDTLSSSKLRDPCLLLAFDLLHAIELGTGRPVMVMKNDVKKRSFSALML